MLQLLIGHSPTYVAVVGVIALGIEAILPIPQFVSHFRLKSVDGFRPSVLIAWLLGDIFKCSYFFFGNANVQWQFKFCAIVQTTFDVGIAMQFLFYGSKQALNINGPISKVVEEEMEEGIIKR